LGDKVKEAKSELEKIRNELPNYRENLQLKYFAQSSLNHLNQNGVTLEDIININGIFTKFANNEFFFSDNQEEFKTGKESKPHIDRAIRWKMFIEKLKGLGDLNSNIIQQKAKLKQLEKEVEEKSSRIKHEWTEINLHYYPCRNVTKIKTVSSFTCWRVQIHEDMHKIRYYNNLSKQISKIMGRMFPHWHCHLTYCRL